LCLGREADGEPTAAVDIVSADGGAARFGDPSRDRESESETAPVGSAGPVAAVSRLEDVRQVVLRNAAAGIVDVPQDAATLTSAYTQRAEAGPSGGSSPHSQGSQSVDLQR